MSLLETYEIEKDFSKLTEKEIKNIPQILTSSEIEKEIQGGRIDLRNKLDKNGDILRLYTIDGEDAKDLDDAIAIEKNGNIFTVYIHIADVSHYIKPDSQINIEAEKRCNSIYLIDTVIPMLPKELSNGICSLNMGEDRFAFTAEVDIDSSGNFVSKKVYISIINVNKRLSYNLVEEILDDPNKKEYSNNLLNLDIDYIDKRNIEYLKELTNILIEKRTKKGYINFDLPETKVLLNDNKETIGFTREEDLFSNKMIEHLMLTANEVVAKICMDKKLPVVYRVHEEPDITRVNEVNSILEVLGVKLRTKKGDSKDSEKEKGEYILGSCYIETINEIKKKLKIGDTDFWNKIQNEEMRKRSETVFRFFEYILLRSMKLARYSSEPIGHFGIGTKEYLHFTAPIRRYSDLFVHRILKSYLYKNNVKNLKKAEEVARNCSEMERKSTELEREYIEIKKCEYMEKFVGEVFSGVITKISNYGMNIELENSANGFIRFRDMIDIYTSDSLHAVGKSYGIKYSIGDCINVLITSVNIDALEIDMKPLNEEERIKEVRRGKLKKDKIEE